MKVAIVQNKPRKGDLERNLDEFGAVFAQLVADTRNGPPDLVLLAEGALTGYFLEGAVYDLALSAQAAAERIARTWREAAGDRTVDLAFGFYENDDGTYYNSAMYLTVTPDSHAIAHVHRKMFLPTYGVFDEERFLSRGRRLNAFTTCYGRAAMLICEDMWHSIMPAIAAIKGARILLAPSASPGRGLTIRSGSEFPDVPENIEQWRRLLRLHASEHGIYIVYAGLAGFEGGKGMSGSSCVVSPRGEILVSGPVLEACIVRAEIDLHEIDRARAGLPLLGDLGGVLADLVEVR